MIVASAFNVQITKALCAETFNQQTGSWLEWLRNFTQKWLGPSTTEESVTWNGTLQYYVAGGHRGRKTTHTGTDTPAKEWILCRSQEVSFHILEKHLKHYLERYIKMTFPSLKSHTLCMGSTCFPKKLQEVRGLIYVPFDSTWLTGNDN